MWNVKRENVKREVWSGFGFLTFSRFHVSRFVIPFFMTLLVGCQPAEPPPPKVASGKDAGQIAIAYCHDHGLDWGTPAFIMQQIDGYYVEFVVENGYKQVDHGLTVGYDGVVHQ
jgi:hypothetical protein